MNSASRSRRDDLDKYDPTFLHSLREAKMIVLLFSIFCIWSVTCCYFAGYASDDNGAISTTMGMPTWAFWGLLVPWLVVDAIAIWFCFFFVADDDLGEAEDEQESDGSLRDGLAGDATKSADKEASDD